MFRKKPNPHELLLSDYRSTPLKLYNLEKEDVLLILYDYLYSLFSYRKVSEKWNIPEEHVHSIISRIRTDLNNLSESWSLLSYLPHLPGPSGVTVDTTLPNEVKNKTFFNPETINTAFLSSLSLSNDPILSEAEQIYAWVYAQTGSNDAALKEAKLNTGLVGQQTTGPMGEDVRSISIANGLKLRGFFLRSKENVQAYIKELRERKLYDLDINKEYIQSQLVQMIEEMQEEGNPANRNRLIRAIELLGKTVPGTFTETINVSEVKPDEALDRLLEMSRAVGRTLPKLSNDPKSIIYEPSSVSEN